MSSRNEGTPWRQGHFLPAAAISRIEASAEERSATAAVVVSHDCDLAQAEEREPLVEIIFGEAVDSLNGSLTHAKNPRVLHLSATKGSIAKQVQLDAARKRLVEKATIAQFEPEWDFLFSPDELNILRKWLARRYRRAAFADEFNNRLQIANAARKLADRAKSYGSSIRSIYFDLDDGEDNERDGSTDLYQLGIVIVFDASDYVKNEKAAAEFSGKIEKIFRGSVF